jgi:hypothetical protein
MTQWFIYDRAIAAQPIVSLKWYKPIEDFFELIGKKVGF